MPSASDEECVAFVGDASPHLLRMARATCGDPVRAEELVQTALEKVHTGRRRVDNGPEETDALVRALATLTPPVRQVVVLRHFVDSSREVTATLDVGTVRSSG